MGEVVQVDEAMGREVALGAQEGPARVVRKRRRGVGVRSRKVLAAFSDAEFMAVEAAARQSGLTVTGFVASRALAHARGEVSPLPSSVVEAMRDLMEARTLLRRYGTLLNQSVAKLNATGVADAGLAAAVERCDAATARVDGAAAHLARHR